MWKKLKNIFHIHKYEEKEVHISSEQIEESKKINSKVSSTIYNKFTIPNGGNYSECLICGKIRK